MKKYLLTISAVLMMTFISGPGFSQMGHEKKQKPTAIVQEEGEEMMRLAIMDLVPKDVSPMAASKVSELLRTAMFNTGYFTVLERNEIESVLKEQKLSMTGVTDERSAVKIGKVLSANKILIGTVMKLGEKTIINARIVDIEKGKLDFAEKTVATKEEDLDVAYDDFANMISARITGKSYSAKAVKKAAVQSKR